MADAVGRIGGAANRFLAEILGMSAKTSLCDMAVLSTGERHTVMFQIDYGFRRLFGEQFGRVLVDEPIAAFDRVEVVPVPVVFFDVAEAGRNAAFRATAGVWRSPGCSARCRLPSGLAFVRFAAFPMLRTGLPRLRRRLLHHTYLQHASDS